MHLHYYRNDWAVAWLRHLITNSTDRVWCLIILSVNYPTDWAETDHPSQAVYSIPKSFVLLTRNTPKQCCTVSSSSILIVPFKWYSRRGWSITLHASLLASQGTFLTKMSLLKIFIFSRKTQNTEPDYFFFFFFFFFFVLHTLTGDILN